MVSGALAQILTCHTQGDVNLEAAGLTLPVPQLSATYMQGAQTEK